MKGDAAIILAAGKGTRMKSKRAKVLHSLAGLPMLSHVINLVQSLQFENVFVIVGHQAETVSKLVSEKEATALLQEPPRGTGDAVLQAKAALKGFQGPVLILNGDTPLLQKETIERFLAIYKKENATLALMTVCLDHPEGYGRVIRREDGRISHIVEQKDATEAERRVQEVNAGIYLCDADFLFKALEEIEPNNLQSEYYLTDIVGIAVSEGVTLLGFEAQPEEVIGINSRTDLAQAEAVMRKRINEHWMMEGVTLIDPDRVRIDASVKIGRDSILYPGVSLEEGTTLGEGVTAYACRIRDSRIGDHVMIKDHCVIDQAEVETGAIIGPFAHLRPQTVIRKNAKIGNFVEVKKSVVGEGSKASHLTYLGDAIIGKNVNIGAGTITCNYDGQSKSETVIEDGVFVGSDTQFIAPVHVGKGALIAAGTTVTRDVPPESLAISRVKQENRVDWVKKQNALKKDEI